MNFFQNLNDLDSQAIPKSNTSKINIAKDTIKNHPSNQKTININKEKNLSEAKTNNNNINTKPKEYISSNEFEEKEEEPEEEEINSDEYVSSTMLDVDTNTYLN